MTFNHRKKKTIRRKQCFSKRKSAKTHRRRRVRIMRGGRRVWKVTVYGKLTQKKDSVILYNNCTFSFDDTISANATEITGNLFLPGVIDVTLLFTQDERDKTIYHPPSNKYMINAEVSLDVFRRIIPTSAPTAAPPPIAAPAPLPSYQ